MKRTLEKPYFLFTLKSKKNPSLLARIVSLTLTVSFLSKKLFYQFLLALVIVLTTFQGNATIYYVSSTGNDANAGTSENYPWRTLTKANSISPKAGDQILFKRGESWVGSITINASGISGSPIIYGAYGTGEKPKIYGSEEINGWTLHSGNIYKTSSSQTINQLFVNNVRAVAARYPNTGYAKINTVNSTESFTCTNLNGSINYSGAKWIARTSPYSTESVNIASSNNNTLTLSRIPYPNLNLSTGFILVGKLELLDSPGEWYYDTNSKTVYFWAPNGDSPANYSVRASVYDYGVTASYKNYITIQDLEILHHKECGIFISGSYQTVDNNSISSPDTRGIYISYGSYITISNNTVSGANHAGIYGYTSNSIYTDNYVTDIFLFNNIGISGGGAWYMGSGMYVEGNDNSIKYNKVVNVGYNGIQFHKRNIVENNFIKNVLLTKDDGGGIYTAAAGSYPNAPTAGSIIRYNIIDGALGTLEGCNPYGISQGHGIYLDENSGGVVVENNTVTNASYSGIYLHNSFNEIIRYNTSFNNGRQYHVNTDFGGSQITDNIFYALSRNLENYANQYLGSKRSADITINNNTLINHYNSSNIFKLDEVKNYDFNGWKAATGQDVNSTIDITALASGEKEELFYNDTKLSKTFDLGSSVYRDIFGVQVKGTLTLAPFTSKILIKTTSVVSSDVTKPSITGFTIPATSSSLTAPVSSFTATDNVAVTGFKITETATTPNAADAGWYTSAPASYSFATEGIKTLYAWVKDAAGNISSNVSRQVTVTVTLTSISSTTSEYLLEEPTGLTVIDSKGANNGTIINSVQRVAGIRGGGLQFTGSGYVNLGKSFGDNVQDEITLSAWIKPTATGGWQGIIMHGSPSLDNFALYINSDLKKIVFRTRNTESVESQWTEITNTSLWDGNWHQVTATYNGSQKVIYIDGVAITTVSAAGVIESGGGYDLIVGGGREYAWGGTLYQGLMDEVRIYNYALTSSEIADLYNLVNPVAETVYTTENISICEGGSYRGWSTTGEYQRILIAASGGDSIVTTNLIVNPVYNITENITINEGEDYLGWTVTGAYESIYTTILGCDSILNTILTVNQPILTTEYVTITEGEDYNGWTEPGEYELYFTAVSGEDSIVTVYLKVAKIINTTEEVVICEGDSYQGWTLEGQYQRTLEAVSGADSIVTTNLVVNSTHYATEEITIAEGESYMGWNQTGEYVRTLTSVIGCDSIVTTILVVNPIIYTTENISICEGDSYMDWTSEGQYIRTLKTISGADSIVTTNLKVNPVQYVTEEITISEGENYMGWNIAGEYVRTLTSINGCDSIITTTLVVNLNVYTTEYITICEGNSYEGWTTEGQYLRSLKSVTGTDSVVTTVLQVNPIQYVTEEITISEGESYLDFTEAGEYVRTLTSVQNCDSVVTTILIVNPILRTVEYITINEGEEYCGWTLSGEYERTLVSSTGSDSIVTTYLKVAIIIQTTEDIVICQGSSYEGWDVTGQYQRVFQTVSGTDSIVITNLLVNPTHYTTEEITISEGENYFGWTQPGEYTRTLVSVTGCDSIVTTYLVKNEAIISQGIELERGWNYFSSSVIPENVNLEAVVETLQLNGQLIEVQDEDGNSYARKSAKHGWINTIGNLQKSEGYKIKVSTSCNLEISGQPVKRPLNIDIKPGENLISFPYRGSVNAMKVIQPLIDAGILNKVQDEKGNSIEFWGASVGWINGIGNFKEGEGYLVIANNYGTLPIEDVYEKSELFFADNTFNSYFNVSYIGNGSNHMNINIVGLNETELQVGDEIAAFDGEICVGVVKLNQYHIENNIVSINASLTDENANNGFIEGNPIELMFWKASANGEVELFPEVLEGSFTYKKLASVFVGLNNQTTNISEELNGIDIDLYPNPATNNVVIRFSSMPDKSAQIILSDITGKQLLNQVVLSTKEILDIRSFSAGIYFVKTVVGETRTVKKLIIN